MSHLVSAILVQVQRVAALDPTAALELCDRVVDLAADRDDYCLVRGQCHLAVNDLESARFWIARAMVLGSADPAGLLSLGGFRSRSGDRSRASAVYRTAIAWLPDSAALYNGLSNAELDGDAAFAQRTIARALRLDPQLPEALTNAGVLAHRHGNQEMAVDLLLQALVQDPAMAPALVNLGTVLQSQGETMRAERVLARALRVAPDIPTALNAMAVVCLSRGAVDAAEMWFRRAIAVLPTYSEALFNLGSLRQEMGDVLGAHIIYGRADADSFRAIGLFNTGIAYIAEERYEEAVLVLGNAAALAPTDAGIRNQIGVALVSLKRDRDAMASIRAALCLSPGAPEYYYNLGLAACQSGDPLVSPKAFERSVLLEFHSPELAFSGMGLAKLRNGDPAGAEAALRISLALAPSSHRIYTNLGSAFQLVGKSDEALDALVRGLRCVREDPDTAMLNLGQAYLGRGEIEIGLVHVRRSLALRPGSRIGLFCVGYALMVQERPADAEPYFARAVQIDPNYGLAWHNYGAALHQQGRFEKAVECFQRLGVDDPDQAATHLNLAIVYESSGRLRDAEHRYRLAIQHDSGKVAARNNLGILLQRTGRDLEALEVLREASLANAEAPGAHSNLGNLHRKLGNLADAMRCYRRSIAVDPAWQLGHHNYGCTLLAAGEPEASQLRFRRAIAVEPHHAPARYNLACALHAAGDVEAAISSYREVVAADQEHYRALNNLAGALRETGQDSEARELHERAKRVAARQGIDPALLEGLSAPDVERLDEVLTRIEASEDRIAGDAGQFQEGGVGSMFPDAVWNKSLLDLSMGNLGAGWDGYEFRWFSATASGNRKFRQPPWDGKRDIAGKRLLIWREQGIGDEIMFASCVPDLAGAGASVTLECAPKLVPLFRRSFLGVRVVGPSDRPDEERDDFDVHLPAGSLPRFYRRSLSGFPVRDGFLIPDPARVAHWRRYLETLGDGPYVGMSWRSRLQTVSRSRHYTQIGDWEPILRTPGVVFINMQSDDSTDEMARLRDALGVVPHSPPGIDMWNNLDDVAALLKALDLLITVNTAVMCIAGGAGVPTWLMAVENFGWPSLGTDRLPWYPSVRLFNRNLRQPWLATTQSVADELHATLPRLCTALAGA